MIQIKTLEDGTEINVDYWAHFIDDSKEEVVEVLTIVDKYENVYSSISETFRKNFFQMVEIFDEDEFSIVKISGFTKDGQTFVNCDLAE